MTDKQYKKFMIEINCEIDEYRKDMLLKSKAEIYDSNYEIRAYEEIHDYLQSNAINLDYKGLPKKNILNDLYYHFMKTDYNLTNEDLFDFLESEITDNKKYHRFKDEEM